MRALAGLVCAAVLGCTGSPAPSASGSAGAGGGGSHPTLCGVDQVPGDTGCETVGVPASACAPGALAKDGGGCQPAGIPPSHCAMGFVPEADACTPILPARACAPGTMAVPGDASCREVAPCADGDWGDIPVDATTQYVKADYLGSTSDGTASQPWKAIQQAIDAAPPGGMVAVAAGAYTEGLTIAGKPVRVWGRCPGLVTIDSGSAESTIGEGADGSELHGLSLTGSGWGIVGVSHAKAVLLEHLRIHDGAVKRGFDLTTDAEVTVRGSLVENIPVTGIMVWGATATVEATEVRDTHGDNSGYGIVAGVDPTTGITPTVHVRGSLVSHNQSIGVYLSGAQGMVDATVIRETQPKPDGTAGEGLVVQIDPDSLDRSSVTLRTSVLERNSLFSLAVHGSDLVVEDTLIVDTQPSAADQEAGLGAMFEDDLDTMEVTHGTVRTSVVERARGAALAAIGSELLIEGVLVRETLPQASDQAFGHGLEVVADSTTGLPASATVRGSVFEKCTDLGLLVSAAGLTLEDTAVRDTLPSATTGLLGRGIDIQGDPAAASAPTATIRRSLIENSFEVGVFVAGGELTLEATTIRNTHSSMATGALGVGLAVQPGNATAKPAKASVTSSRIDGSQSAGLLVAGSVVTVDRSVIAATAPDGAQGLFGDGILVESVGQGASVTITRSVVEGSSRAGISSFAADVSLGGSVLECNSIHLDSEVYHGDPTFEDLGGNVCGCKGKEVECAIMSSSLTPPDSVGAIQD